MKTITLLMLSSLVFATGGYGGTGTGTWPEAKYVLNLDEIKNIKPSFKLRKINKHQFFTDKEQGLILIQTEQRLVAVKNYKQVEKYNSIKVDIDNQIEAESLFNDIEEAKSSVINRLNENEVKPFVVKDFLVTESETD